MRLLLIHIICFLPIVASSQKLEVTTNKDEILIGQELVIEYTVQANKSDSILFEPSQQAIGVKTKSVTGTLTSLDYEFEILKNFETETIQEQKGTTWIGRYTVTSWDSGMFLIPGAKIVINDSTHYFPDLTVRSLLVPKKEDVDIYDIRENYADVPEGLSSLLRLLKNYWWLIAILCIGIAYLIYRRKNRNVIIEEEPKLASLKERTLRAIEALEAAKLWEKNELKMHFVELSYILRSYLTARYNISMLEKTTHESALLLAQCGLEKETIDVIIKVLSQADMVKFAKSKPDEISILRISAQAKQVVAETSPLEFENVE